MEIEKRQVTRLVLTELDRLDPVGVVTEDFGESQGMITITCYGEAWTAYWGAMGPETIAEFFCSADEHYLAKNLSSIEARVTDYDKLSDLLGECVERETLILHHERLAEIIGCDWYSDLPQMANHKYTYLCRIIRAVQEGLKVDPDQVLQQEEVA